MTTPRIMSALCAAALLACAGATPVATTAVDPSCAAVQVPDQRRDEATLRRIERAWLAAERRGDVRFLHCLLLPTYVNIGSDGRTHPGADIIAHAAKNAGKEREVPPIDSTIVVHRDTATAYSRSRTQDKDGQWRDVRFIDSFVFEAGAWHAYTGVDL